MTNNLCIFCTNYPTCDGQLLAVSSELTVLWLLGFYMLITPLFYLSETRSDGMTQYIPLVSDS